MEKALPDGNEWVSCRCCGKLFPAENVVRLHNHPDDVLCVRCVEWLHATSRPIVRRLYPIWHLPVRFRARVTHPEDYATDNYPG